MLPADSANSPNLTAAGGERPGERLQKILARRVCGSRRIAERMIDAGRVSVNGRVATLGDRALPADEIVVDGQALDRSERKRRHLLLHKPCGFVVSRRPQKQQRGVFELLPEKGVGEWVSVGRLDVNTSGLLLLTNDGELAHRLMHPSTGVSRVYLVRVRMRGRATDESMQNLLDGVMLGERMARFDKIDELRKGGGSNRWFRVSLREGRNREVRRLWESQGLAVSRLIRVAYGSLNLDIPTGRWRELSDEETEALYADARLPVAAGPLPA